MKIGPAVIFALILLQACVHEPFVPEMADVTIKLKWYENYPGETRADVDTGFLWTLSFLGAELKKGDYEKAVVWEGESVLSFDPVKAGFDKNATDKVLALCEIIKSSEAYATNGSADIGRFVALAMNAPDHYYAITGVPQTLGEFLNGNAPTGSRISVLQSTVSVADRLIEMPDSILPIQQTKFIAQEGDFDTNNAFKAHEFEVLDIMPNGNLRFAIYDLDSQLIRSADDAYSLGGKPSKCQWCHEAKLSINFSPHSPVPGYASVVQLNSEIEQWTSKLSSYRASKNLEVDYEKVQNHELAELLYLGFIEPSALRLSLEWGMGESEVVTLLESVSIHDNSEHDFMTKRYYRRDVRAYEPLKAIRASDSDREGGGYEPNLLF